MWKHNRRKSTGESESEWNNCFFCLQTLHRVWLIYSLLNTQMLVFTNILFIWNLTFLEVGMSASREVIKMILFDVKLTSSYSVLENSTGLRMQAAVHILTYFALAFTIIRHQFLLLVFLPVQTIYIKLGCVVCGWKKIIKHKHKTTHTWFKCAMDVEVFKYQTLKAK